MQNSGPDTRDILRLGLKGIVKQVPDLHSGRIVSTTIKLGLEVNFLAQKLTIRTKFNRGSNNMTRM